MQEEVEDISWAEYILSRAKVLFGTDLLENDDVCEYFIQSLIKFKKTVIIDGDFGWAVCYSDVEAGLNYAIFCGKNKEECENFCLQRGLTISREE